MRLRAFALEVSDRCSPASRADARYELDRDGCKALSDNAREICVVQAKGKEKVTRAEAEASYENTPNARYEARLMHARVDYEVSMERCGDFAGHRKDVCKTDANAELVRARTSALQETVIPRNWSRRLTLRRPAPEWKAPSSDGVGLTASAIGPPVAFTATGDL